MPFAGVGCSNIIEAEMDMELDNRHRPLAVCLPHASCDGFLLMKLWLLQPPGEDGNVPFHRVLLHTYLP